MKVVLLNTPLKKEKISRDMAGGLGFDATDQILLPPIDLALIAAQLRRKKHRVKIIDPEAEEFDEERVLKEIFRFNPSIVVGTVSLPTVVSDTQFFKKLKKSFGGKLIGKTSITFLPLLKEILKKSKIDYCLIGEPEFLINEILSEKERRGTVRLEKNKLIFDPAPFEDDLDKLPLPARDLLNNSAYQYPLLGGKCSIVQTSRGCPFPCAYYCPYPLVQGKKWRAMSVVRAYCELVDIVKKYRIKRILFRDATFTFNRERTIELCRKIIKNKLKFDWWCETRVNCLDRNLLKIMKQAGCQGINIGVETGDPKVMDAQGKPGVSLSQLKSIKQAADDLEIKLHFLLLIGLPQETKHSLFLTFKLVKNLRPYSLGVTVVTPYPGTELYKEAKKKGWIESQDWSRYSGNLSTMHTDNFSGWEMKLVQKMIVLELILQEKGFLGRIGLLIEEGLFRLWAKI